MSEHDVQPNIELIANKQDVMPFELHSFELPTTNVRGFKRAALLLATGGALLTACGASEVNNDNQPISTENTEQIANTTTQTTGITTPTTREASTTTTTEDLADLTFAEQLQRELTVDINDILPESCISIVENSETAEIVTVNGEEFVKPDYNVKKKYIEGSDDVELRKHSDSLMPPLSTNEEATAEEKYEEFEGRLCEDGHYREVILHFVANLKINGVPLGLNGDNEEWLGEYVGMDVSELDNIAEEFSELHLNRPDGFTNQAEGQEYIDLYNEGQKKAVAVVDLIRKFSATKSVQATVNDHYALDNGGIEANAYNPGLLPDVTILSTSYEGNFLQIEAIGKDGVCYMIFLINEDDGRPAKSRVCVVELPPTTTTQARPTTTTEGSTTTTEKKYPEKTAPTYPDGEIPADNEAGPVTKAPATTSTTAASTTTQETIPAVTVVPTTEAETGRTSTTVNND